MHKNLKVNADYSPNNYFELNIELLDYLKEIKEKYPLYIFTKGALQNEPEFKTKLDKIFKYIFSAWELGISKEDPNAFHRLAKEINTKPEEILFIDDSLANIGAAKQAGLETIHYQNNEQLFEKLKILGI